MSRSVLQKVRQPLADELQHLPIEVQQGMGTIGGSQHWHCSFLPLQQRMQ